MKNATCHKDGTVTYWSVYTQSWAERQTWVPDNELAAMNEVERNRVIRHLEDAGWRE
jgi:hypothetical protein